MREWNEEGIRIEAKRQIKEEKGQN